MDQWNELEIRCPRLGHEIKFPYCKTEGGGMPCFRILQCWQGYIPVGPYLKAGMTQEKWELFISSAPKNKIISLVELIEAAKKR